MYSTHNEGNSVIAERFIRTLKKNLKEPQQAKMILLISSDFDNKLKDVRLNKNELNGLSKKVKAI